MLPAAHRVRRSTEFRAVVRRGARLTTPAFVVHVERTTAPTRFGFVVSKAVGNAVTRNSVKRRMREAARSLLAQRPNNMDVVVRAKALAADVAYSDIVRQLETVLNKWWLKEESR